MYAKEGINDTLTAGGMDPTAAGVLAGAGGGIAQVSVMGRCRTSSPAPCATRAPTS